MFPFEETWASIARRMSLPPISPFPFERLPVLKRAHLKLLRSLREQVGPGAGTAFSSWARGFLDSEDASEATIEICTIWSAGEHDRDGDRDRDPERLRRDSSVALRLLGPGLSRGWLLLDSKVASAVRGLMLRTPPLPLVDTPTAAEHGLIAYAVAGLLHELGPECAWSLTLEDEGSGGEGWFGIEARVELNNLAGLVRLLVTEEVLDHSRPSRSRQLRAARAGRLAAIEIELPVVLGRFCLTALEMEHLGEGDVILAECCAHPPETPLRARVSVGERWLPAVVEENRVTLTGPCQRQHRGGHGMSSTAESGPDGSSSGADSGSPGAPRSGARNRNSLVDELPLEVVVELGRLKLKGAQLLDLGPGDVLTLDRPVMGPIDLRIGDRLIAKGELVSVEGEAGVRLIEVYD
jgi:flagellar motor switch protein FliN/FliY